MPNKKLASEWLDFARKDLETAILLDKENHYTDVIAIDTHQAIEKALKAIYVHNGEKIPRTHSLDILYNYAEDFIDFKGIEIKDLLIISDYYQSERYPGPKYYMPDREEIKQSIEYATTIFNQVTDYINGPDKLNAKIEN